MEEKKNKFMSVVYQLYSLTDGEKNLEEQTGDERPFEFITGFSIALDAFEQQVMKLEKGSKFAIREGGLTVGAGTVTEIIA